MTLMSLLTSVSGASQAPGRRRLAKPLRPASWKQPLFSEAWTTVVAAPLLKAQELSTRRSRRELEELQPVQRVEKVGNDAVGRVAEDVLVRAADDVMGLEERLEEEAAVAESAVECEEPLQSGLFRSSTFKRRLGRNRLPVVQEVLQNASR